VSQRHIEMPGLICNGAIQNLHGLPKWIPSRDRFVQMVGRGWQEQFIDKTAGTAVGGRERKRLSVAQSGTAVGGTERTVRSWHRTDRTFVAQNVTDVRGTERNGREWHKTGRT
jgi:hypothetical protein